MKNHLGIKTNLLACIGLLCLSFLGRAQAPVKLWDKTLGGTNRDEPYSIIHTPDGGFVVAGESESDMSGDKSENARFSDISDYWIVKLDAIGNKVWDKTIGGSYYDGARSIVSSPDGGLVIAGESYSGISGDKSENRIGTDGYLDYWIVKLDASGNIVWDKTIGGGFDDDVKCIVNAPGGGFVVAGKSESDISGDKSENSRGEYDYWIVKLDSSGNKVWDKTIGGSGDDYAQSIVNALGGGFVIAGESYSGISGDKSENSIGTNGYFDYWIVKLDASGNKIWDKTLGGSDYDRARSIVSTPDGGLVVAGSSNSDISGDKSENSIGGRDCWTVKLDSNGNKIWDKTLGGSGTDQPQSIVNAPGGGFAIAGYSNSDISGDKSENSIGTYGAFDYWIVKLDANGNKVWDKTIGGNRDDYATSIISTPNRSFVLVGKSYSVISGDKSENSIDNSDDYWVVSISNPCPEMLTHSGSLAAGAYQAGQGIQSTADVASPTVYRAGGHITLSPGFRAGPAEVFQATIQGCE